MCFITICFVSFNDILITNQISIKEAFSLKSFHTDSAKLMIYDCKIMIT